MSPTFYWVPYFEGKRLNYYQYFALVGSTVMAIIALILYTIYLQLKKCNKQKRLQGLATNTKLESFFYRATFGFLSMVPLICSATDTINTVFGMVGMMAILSYMVITNTRQQLERRHQGGENQPLLGVTALQSQRTLKKKLLIVGIISIVVPLFCHRTCLCFYNNEIGYYNNLLGFGINTMFTRFFQLQKACPPGPPCHLYTTLPEDSITSVFVNLHTHIGVDNVTVHYQEIDAINSSQEYKVQARTY